MLVALTNVPRDYAWGSHAAIAALQGRAASDRPEAEVWFGDHPGSPARVAGRELTLDRWLDENASAAGIPPRLPYLMKLLAAAQVLSIQAHPSLAQAQEGFAREEAAGIPLDASERTYRDANHKPEVIVALSDPFRALAGLRERSATRALLSEIGGPGAEEIARRLGGDDADMRALIGWLFMPDAGPAVADLLVRLPQTEPVHFAAELENLRGILAQHPGDPGVVVALLLNYVTLRPGEAIFVPAGVLHAYVEGLGVELMAASDNVLRGGLTPKHIDVAELVRLLDPRTGPAPLLPAVQTTPGVWRYAPEVSDFALLRVTRSDADAPATRVEVRSPAIALAVSGEPVLSEGGQRIRLAPGEACLIAAADGLVEVDGTGALFVAEPGSPL